MESKPLGSVRFEEVVQAFNRTSMESKLKAWHHRTQYATAFNRTSMESKQVNPKRIFLMSKELLIAPVWNRNENRTPMRLVGFEPFNRTSMESKLDQL